MPSLLELLTRRRAKVLSTTTRDDRERVSFSSNSPVLLNSPRVSTSQVESGSPSPPVVQRIHPDLNALAEELAPSIQESSTSTNNPATPKRISSFSLDSGDGLSLMSLTPWIRNRRDSTGGTANSPLASPPRITTSTTPHDTTLNVSTNVHPVITLEELPESASAQSSSLNSTPEHVTSATGTLSDRIPSSSSSPVVADSESRANRFLSRLAGITHRSSLSSVSPTTPSPTRNNPPSAWNTFGQRRSRRVKSRNSIPHMTDFGFGRSNSGADHDLSYASSQKSQPSSAYGEHNSPYASLERVDMERPQSQLSQQSRGSEWYYGHSLNQSQNESSTLSRAHSKTQSNSQSQSRSPSQVFVTPASTPGGNHSSPPSSGFTFGSGTLGRFRGVAATSSPPPSMPKLRLSLFGRMASTGSGNESAVDMSGDAKVEDPTMNISPGGSGLTTDEIGLQKSEVFTVPSEKDRHAGPGLVIPMPRLSISMPSIGSSIAQPPSVPPLLSMPSMPSLNPRLRAQDIFTNIAQSTEGMLGSDIATAAVLDPSASGVSSRTLPRTWVRKKSSRIRSRGISSGKRPMKSEAVASDGDDVATGAELPLRVPTISEGEGATEGNLKESRPTLPVGPEQGGRVTSPFALGSSLVLQQGLQPQRFDKSPSAPVNADTPGVSSNSAVNIAGANVTASINSLDPTLYPLARVSSPLSSTPSSSASSANEKIQEQEPMPTSRMDKGKAKADATTSFSLSPPPPAHSTHYSGIYSTPRIPSPLAQDQERRRTRLMSAPTSATSPLPMELKASKMRPATASSLTSAGWKRKAEDGEDETTGGHRKRATFAAETYTRPRQISGSSYTAGRKRVRLSTVSGSGEMDDIEDTTPVISGPYPRSHAVNLSRNSTQRSRKVSQPASLKSGHGHRRNISSSYSHASQAYSQFSHFSQSQSPYDSSSQLQHQQNPSTTKLSSPPSITSSIPVSALITPRAPSVSVSQHRSATGGYHYHMRDPRKPPKVRPTSWGLSFPQGEQTGSKQGRGFFDLLREKWSWKRQPSEGISDGGRGGDVEKAPYAHELENSMSRNMTGSSSGHRGWIEAGGSPIHAWLFFLGFVVFPLWLVGGFLVGIPRTRKLGGGTEKGVVLDDPQVEHDALSWRTRCRVMVVVSLFTYVPFVVLVVLFIPRGRG